MLRKERTEEHVRGRPKDHASNMQTEFHGTAKTRNSMCRGKNAEAPKATKFRVGGETPKIRIHEILCDGGKSPKIRKYGISCDMEFRVLAKYGIPCFDGKT
jgi:hypothetical protein